MASNKTKWVTVIEDKGSKLPNHAAQILEVSTMNFMLQTRGRRFTLYALTIIAGMVVSCGVLALIGYSSNQKLPTGPAITDRMEALDKLRLEEALHLKAELGDQIWLGYAALDAPVIIWNEDYEFLFGVSSPPAGWEVVPDDKFDGRPYYRRPADDPQNFAVRVGDQWAASIFTKYLADAGLISAIRGLLPPGIAEVFPYKIFIQPSELQISAVQHEYFHVVQAEIAPVKFAAAEGVHDRGERYWPLDETMRSAWREEIDVLIKAVQTSHAGDAKELTRQFLAIRARRRQDIGLDKILIDYERQLEWLEGTAKFAELFSWQEASQNHGYLSLSEMATDPDFKDYETFNSHWNQEIAQTKRQARVEGEVRFYYTGMLQAYLLDRLLPEWKDRFMEEGVYLEDLLGEAIE